MPDLITIPGFAELQALTLGDSRIKIAVLDGPADLDRACFRGANLSRVNPFWQQKLEPIDPIYITTERQIRALTDKKKALKKALKQSEKENAGDSNGNQISPSIAQVKPSNTMRSQGSVTSIFNTLLEDTDASAMAQYRQLSTSKQQKPLQPEISSNINYAAAIAALEAEIKALEDKIPKPVKERLGGIFHATGIFSMMFGQPGSPIEGVAPYCTAINIPLFETATSDESLSPLNMAHAFNLALELGVNIIHCAACHPTTTGFAHEMIQKAVKQCQDNGILIVAPSGNNKGEWFCAPAILPNVLAVGMMKDNGQPANYSNWGGQYQQQGILAPGENILAAEPGTDEPVRQEGTSLSAPLMTGLSALMMSVQLQRGEQPNAEAVRMAFLNSAIPCDPKEVAEPERCLAGKLNIPGAFKLLTGENLLPIPSQPTSTTNSQHFQQVRDYYNAANSAIVQDVGTTYQAGLLATDSDNPFRATNLFLAERAGIKPNDYLLDAGCGAGGPAIDIAQNIEGVKIEAITMSESQAQTARQNVQQAGLSDRIQVHVGDYHQLPFDDNVFDVAYFLESIGYAYDPQLLCVEIYRVLRPGQILYIKELFIKEPPLSEQEQQELAIFQKIYAYKTPRLSQFQEAVQLAGFHEIEVADLSGIVSTEKFVETMFKSSNELSEFGKSHYYPFKAAPVYFAEIKARKPLTTPTTNRQVNHTTTAVSTSQSTKGITSSAVSNKVYALGTLGYDFGTEARRDTFKQRMPAVNMNGVLIPANPYDAHQMVNHLELSPAESKSLIWTLNQELTPIYALEPQKAFANEIYAVFQMLLAGQIQSASSDDRIERVSIPGNLTDRTVELFSGQIVPVLALPNIRGMYGWQVNALVDAAVTTVSPEASEPDAVAMRRSLKSFLHRIYYDLRNLGQLDRDRALNFAATNAFQAASTFAEALASGMGLDSIEVEKSPFCRLNSNCWDIKLKFFDPENGRRSKKVYRFTIDVANIMPVTLGKVRSWSVPR